MSVNGLKRMVAKIDYHSGKLYNRLYCLVVSLLGRVMYPIQILKNRATYVYADSYFPEKKRKSNARILWEQIVWSLRYGVHSIGWDVCLTTDGPLIIEGNDNWDTIDAQFYHPGKKLFDKYFK